MPGCLYIDHPITVSFATYDNVRYGLCSFPEPVLALNQIVEGMYLALDILSTATKVLPPLVWDKSKPDPQQALVLNRLDHACLKDELPFT